MSYETGTATNYLGLLSKLKTFVTTALPVIERWTVNKDVTANGEREVYFKAPGLAGTDNIFINIRTYEDSGDDLYNWELQGAVAFDTNEPFANQAGRNPRTIINDYIYAPFFTLWDSTIKYWFFGDGRRLIIVAKVGSAYFSCHLGFLLPYGTPTEYPYPIFIGGCSGDSRINYANSSGAISNFYDPIESAVFIRAVDGSWVSTYHWTEAGANSNESLILCYPTRQKTGVISKIRSNLDGTYTLLPIIYHSSINVIYDNAVAYGEISGLFQVTGFGQGSEDTITISGKTYLVFQNANKTELINYVTILQE